MKSTTDGSGTKLFGILVIIVALAFAAITAFGLTPQERKMVQTIKAQVEEGQRQYDGALIDVRNAKGEAKSANDTAADTASKLKEAQDKFDAVNKDNERMKPVYDQCTSHWGLGAIAYGVGELVKHLLILLAVIVVLAIGIWILSIAAPETAPFIMLGLRAVGGVFRVAGKGIAAGFGAIHTLLTKLVAKLKPASVPPKVEGS